jgi:ATP-binding cassette subfamily C protein CydD
VDAGRWFINHMKLDLRLLREAKISTVLIILSICLGLVGGVLGIFQARQVSTLINQVFMEGKDLDSVSRLLILLLLIVLLRAGAAWVGELCAGDGARKIKGTLRQRFFSHLTEIGPGFLRRKTDGQETQTGELTNTAIEGIEALDAYYSQYLPQLALAVLIPITILFFVFPADLPLRGDSTYYRPVTAHFYVPDWQCWGKPHSKTMAWA